MCERKKMRKFLSQVLKFLVAVVIIVCGVSCASTGGSESGAKNEVIEAYKKAIVGNWFWNYGYDQNNFANEQGIFNKDGTFELFYIVPEQSEYDRGDYSIINDEKYGPVLKLHLKQWKEKLEQDWQDTDVKIYFAIHSIDDNRILMSRYKRDFTGIGWTVQNFDPGVLNDYRRIIDGNAENLIGKWTVNKLGTPGIDWNESWVFNADGTMEDYWTEAGEETVKYKGKYEVKKEKDGSVIHTTLLKGQNGNESFEINPPMEFWIDYKTCGENLIKVRSLRNIIGGEKHDSERNSDDFYYRELPLETVTYHWDNYSFKDYYPKGDEYKTIGLEKRFLFKNIPDDLLSQNLIGWCDNPELKGNLVEKIAAHDSSSNYEFWAKWGLKCNRNDYDPQNGKYNHDFTIPLSTLAPNMKLPSARDKVMVVLSGKLPKDIDCNWGLRLVDFSDGWYVLGEDWHAVKSKNSYVFDIFELKISGNPKVSDYDKIAFNLCYNPDSLDETITINDFKLEVIDENSSSKIIEHTFNYGDFIFKMKSVSNYDYYLPISLEDLGNLNWQLQGNELLGWYDNPEFKGNPITKLSGAENKESRTFYAKYNLKFWPSTPRDNGGFYSNRGLYVKSVIPDAKISKFNPKAGDVVKVALSATLSKDYDGQIGLDLDNSEQDCFLGSDWPYVESKNKKIQVYFEIKIQKDANYKSIDDAWFLLAYNPLAEGEQLIISDYKFELVDEDPFITTEAESKHVSIKTCAEGLEITVRKLESDKGDWKGTFNFDFGDSKTLPQGYIQEWAINKNEPVTFIWPFCEKGKIYKFKCSWTDSDGKWHGENLKVIAANGKNQLNYKALANTKISVESNSLGAFVSVSNFSKEIVFDLIKNYSDSPKYLGFETPIISGKKDWSDSNWLFAPGIQLYPNLDPNNSFCNDLLSKGKANILGDHNFWWGTKEDINKALSERLTFWTDLRIHFSIGLNSDKVGFYLIPVESDETPYIPVKF